MLVKNVVEEPLAIRMATRVLELAPGEEGLVSAGEVRDPVLRENLQVRTLAIVRPANDAEDATFAEAASGSGGA